MNAIIDFQKYFIDGDETKLKPMVLQYCRKGQSRHLYYLQSSQLQIYPDPFRHLSVEILLLEGLLNEDGEEVSTREIKNVLVQIVENEDKSAPLTDESIVAALSEKGYKVARRTVAKYRDQLGIPVAKQRVELL